jgi:8-oxo-dGTP diphosphatase
MKLIEATHTHKRHFTVTGYVMNKDRTKLLMIRHNKLNKWLPPGGHLEANEVPHEGALREVFEETGVRATVIDNDEHDLSLRGEVDVQIPRPYALLYQLIPEGKKDVEHIHLDMVFAFEADDSVDVSAQLEEVSEAQWLTKEQILVSDEAFESAKGFARLNLV